MSNSTMIAPDALARITTDALKPKGRHVRTAAGYFVADVSRFMNDTEAYAVVFAAAPAMLKTLQLIAEDSAPGQARDWARDALEAAGFPYVDHYAGKSPAYDAAEAARRAAAARGEG